MVPDIFASAQELIRAIDHQSRVETCYLVSHGRHRNTLLEAPTGAVWPYNHLQPVEDSMERDLFWACIPHT
jgi:hypothetical protein